MVSGLIVITLLADGQRNAEAISLWRIRASGIGRVSAGGIFESIEIENEFAGRGEAVIGKNGVEKTASFVSGGGAGGVAKDEEKLSGGGIFEDRFETIGFSGESKFSN